MRTYVGERDEHGRPSVWCVERTPGPPVEEIAEFLAQLRQELERPNGSQAFSRAEELMARKHDLIERITTSEQSSRRPVDRNGEPGNLEWSQPGAAQLRLARAILADHLGVTPTDTVSLAFRDQVVTNLPEAGFRLPADQIAVWVQANRQLVDNDLFLRPPDTGHEQAWSVIEGPRPVADPVDLVEDPATASTLVAALEAAWRDIQSHHPELPDAVMVLGTGVERGRLVKLGHWWGGQWVADGQPRGEVLLAGEALHLEPGRVFEVLLHEAAHGINAARGVKDTSRGGRYHNKEFAKTAQQVLLRVRSMPPYGLAATSLTPDALERYGATIDRLGDAMRIARQLRQGLQVGTDSGEIEGEGKTGGKGSEQGQPKSGSTAASCGCGRKMRMAPSTLAAGPVVCGLCGSEFTNGAEKRLAQSERGDPKKAAAAFKMSFVRRSSQFSRSSSAIRWTSSVEVPGRSPLSISVRLTQFRSVSAPMPNSPATRLTEPCRSPVCRRTSKTIFTARSRSSGGKFRGPGRLPDDVILHPRFQGQEPPRIPGRFIPCPSGR